MKEILTELTPLWLQLFLEAQQQGTLYSGTPITQLPTYETFKNGGDFFKKATVEYCVDRFITLSLPVPDRQQAGWDGVLSKIFGKNKELTTEEIKLRGKEKRFCELLLQALLRTKINYEEEEWIALMQKMKFCDGKAVKMRYHSFAHWPLGFFVKQIERRVKQKGASAKLKNYLGEMLSWDDFQGNPKYYGWRTNMEKLKQNIQEILMEGSSEKPEVLPYYLNEEDAWGRMINQTIKEKKEEEQVQWFAYFRYITSANGGKPTQKFLKTAKGLVDAFKKEPFKETIQEWLQAVTNMKEERVDTERWHYYTFLNTTNSNLLKGMVWSMVQFHDTKTLSILANLAERCYRKIPGVGPAAASVGNACIYVLANSRGLEGISHLSRLRLRIKQANTRKLIGKYLQEAASKLGVTEEEIGDLSVPSYGLTEGYKEVLLGEYTLQITLQSNGKVLQQWIKPDGKPQKTVPTAVKNDSKLADKLKKVKLEVKELQKTYAAQRDRLDRTFVLERQWTYENFEKYYLTHGLTAVLAQRMLWILHSKEQEVSALWRDGRWEDIQGAVVQMDWEQVKVSLWHPVYAETTTILAWRERMETLEWQQPIKQVFRELYLLTDAEVNTRTYSNRMAAHLLKQHQFSALASTRGWTYSLMGAYDDGRENDIAMLHLPERKLKVEYWINEVATDDSFNDAGIWYYVATDQVRFVREEGGEPIPLVDIPKIIFSEVMRDVDLFVGVSSVGNDPEWRDNGGLPQYRDYWQSYSFGDLTEVAKNRKAILERLIPRLKIRNVAEVDGKFLKVKGKIRNYKIHIGSTNILMEPNDQYLCIVPARKKEVNTDKVFLPFEGDRGLSLVLSKAMLLSEDDKIEDPTILSQLHY
ncbi:DUF4132 domain-containing protein [Algivirga pacifica]